MDIIARFFYGPMDGETVTCEEVYQELVFARGEKSGIGYGINGASICALPCSAARYLFKAKRLENNKSKLTDYPTTECAYIWSEMVKSG